MESIRIESKLDTLVRIELLLTVDGGCQGLSSKVDMDELFPTEGFDDLDATLEYDFAFMEGEMLRTNADKRIEGSSLKLETPGRNRYPVATDLRYAPVFADHDLCP